MIELADGWLSTGKTPNIDNGADGGHYPTDYPDDSSAKRVERPPCDGAQTPFSPEVSEAVTGGSVPGSAADVTSAVTEMQPAYF